MLRFSTTSSSPLFQAAQYDDWPTVFSFLDRGYSPDEKCPEGKTLLDYAFFHQNQEAVRVLLSIYHAKIQPIFTNEQFFIFYLDCIGFFARSVSQNEISQLAQAFQLIDVSRPPIPHISPTKNTLRAKKSS